jgi:glutaredoxin
MNIQIYTKPDCPFCVKAKQFLKTKELSYSEKVLGIDITAEKFVEKFQHTFPAILINNNLIGGYDQMLLLYSISPELFVG